MFVPAARRLVPAPVEYNHRITPELPAPAAPPARRKTEEIVEELNPNAEVEAHESRIETNKKPPRLGAPDKTSGCLPAGSLAAVESAEAREAALIPPDTFRTLVPHRHHQPQRQPWFWRQGPSLWRCRCPPTPSRAQTVFVERVFPGDRSFRFVFTLCPAPETEAHTAFLPGCISG